MASIQNVHLTITESQEMANVTVAYDLIGSARDVEERPIYLEFIDLEGDDEGPGEDGHSEFIPGGNLFTSLTRFGPGEASFHREKSFRIASSLLDEDRGTGPSAAIPVEDEIRVRVKLTPLTFSATARSNKVTRGGLPTKKVGLIPA